jgi:mono/diheme cytochrome c family protein
MRARIGSAMVMAAVLGIASAGTAHAATAKDMTAHNDQSYDEIARGRYLATAADCAACHTVADQKPYAGGFAVVTPFGVVLSANITSDPDTGIGGWSDDDFVKAVQDGIAKGGVHLYPAMPYPYYAKMSRDDVLAIRSYLDTLEPAHHKVVDDQLPFPFKYRAGMIAWNALFFHDGGFQPIQGKSDDWNRGAYLVEGAGHCGACHTPKNFLGGDDTSDALQGGAIQGWFSPDLTSAQHHGLADWSADDIVAYLKTGRNVHSAASGPMSDVIRDSTSQLHDNDLKALAAYLKDQPGTQSSPGTAIAGNDPAMRAGQAIFVDNCSACHAADGTGVANLIPPLKDNPIVQSIDPTSLIRVVLHGTQNVATDQAPTGPAMPDMAWKLSDQQAASVITYVRNVWGNIAPAVPSSAVAKIR